jgi:23S rRNA (pseudouridine1915-N3)-methyltransferase
MIRVICGGRKHRGWTAEGIAEYEKRLRKPYDISWQFVDEERLAGVKAFGLLVVLDERGEMWDSVKLSDMLAQRLFVADDVTFVIGGAYEVPTSLRERADVTIALGRMVLPHEMCRLILTEQIYRAQEIARGGKYHHA